MRIVVEDLPERQRKLTGSAEVDLSKAASDDELRVSGPVAYDLTLERRGSTVHVDGVVEAEVEAACSRCAKRVPVAVRRTFTESFAAANEREGVLPRELDENDLDLDYYEGDAIDGLQLLAEQIFLGLPMKILCADDCKGLCVTCGADLNVKECDCKPDVDPRWSDLEGLRDQL